MPHQPPVLLAVDETEASEQAASRLTSELQGPPPGGVLVLNVLPPLPPGLLEHGGSESPSEEAHLEQQHRRARERWMADSEERARHHLQRIQGILEASGVPGNAISKEVVPAHPADRVADHILAVARSRGCHTVVVGRHALPWHQEAFRRHVGERLAAAAGDLDVRILE